ncbi:protein of unknown function [Streptomyces murinus]
MYPAPDDSCWGALQPDRPGEYHVGDRPRADTDLATLPLLDALRPAMLVPEAGWRQAAGTTGRPYDARRCYGCTTPVRPKPPRPHGSPRSTSPGASWPSPSNASPSRRPVPRAARTGDGRLCTEIVRAAERGLRVRRFNGP